MNERRQQIERLGWRTSLDWTEDLVRTMDGKLVAAEPIWTASAEHRTSGIRESVEQQASTEDVAWALVYAAVTRT